VLDSCAAAGFSPDFVIQTEDYATAQGFVAAGLGIGLMPRLGLRTPHPGVVVREVRNPEPVRVISAAARRTAPEQPALRGLVDALREAAGTVGTGAAGSTIDAVGTAGAGGRSDVRREPATAGPADVSRSR
jgi:DNA-binding transcriptional LysR family regulator